MNRCECGRRADVATGMCKPCFEYVYADAIMAGHKETEHETEMESA